MLGVGSAGRDSLVLWPDVASNRGLVMLGIALAISFFPLIRWPRVSPVVVRPTQFVVALLLLSLSAVSMANMSFNPFIYFRV